MVARIAPSPITSPVAIGDALTHATGSVPSAFATNPQQNGSASGFERHDVAQASNNAPPLPAPPGEAFAAAVLAGQLPPRPMTPEQLRQRLGSAWQPPASPLRLMDRSA
jgi:hypothetical protein